MQLSNKASYIAFFLGLMFVIYNFYPVLAPIMDSELLIIYGDINTIIGSESGEIRKNISIYSFFGGGTRQTTNRFVLLGGWSILSEFIEFSDAQFTSALILISMIIGSVGIYQLVRHFEKNDRQSAIMILLLIPFYFLNLWSVERISHIWIWYTYAIFPMFIQLGLQYLTNRKTVHLFGYCLLFGVFGFLPHSFLYMLIFHIGLTTYSYFRDKKETIKFFFVPLVIFVLLNAPSFLLAKDLELEYPIKVTTDSFGYLSKHGEILNLFAFSNNWWPQVPDYLVFRNILFRYSGFGLFAISFIIFVLSYQKLGIKEKQLSVIFMMGIFAVIFLARGHHNEILSYIMDIIAGIGLAQLLGPMREWARISILIPAFLIVIITIGLNKIQRPKKQILIGGFIVMLLVNILLSPGTVYLRENYAAAYLDENWKMIEDIPKENKAVLYLGRDLEVPVIDIFGQKKQITRPNFEGTVSTYGSIRALRDAPDELLDALNIHHIVRFGNDADEEGWDCKSDRDITICTDGKETMPFSVYEGTVLAADEEIYSAVKIQPENFAITSSEENHTKFILNNETKDDQYSIFLFEAEDDFNYKRYRKNTSYIESSNRTIIISRTVQIERNGTYEIVVHGKGSFETNISNRSMNLESESLANIDGGKIQLEKGKYNLSIRIGNYSVLDFVSISETPEFQNNTSNARIIGYERINPTLWTVKIDSSKPFLLGFAEKYSKFWELRMNGKVIKPIKLYGQMNGYWIDETGELDITMRYASQDSFEMGMGISILTVILGSIYVLKRWDK